MRDSLRGAIYLNVTDQYGKLRLEHRCTTYGPTSSMAINSLSGSFP